MQEEVTENINDLEFLKLAITTEIDKIKINIEELLVYPKVQNYISLVEKRENLKQNKLYKDPLRADLKDKIEKLFIEYKEVKQYEENIRTLKYYNEALKKIEDLISKNGIIYNKEKNDKKYYSCKTVLKYLLTIKKREGLPLQTDIEELNRYICAVRNTLQTYIHYEDDKKVDEILSFKIYENPHNYDIKNVRELPSLDLEYLYETDNLTEREKEAFFGRNAHKALGIQKETDNVKRIGAKKNV